MKKLLVVSMLSCLVFACEFREDTGTPPPAPASAPAAGGKPAKIEIVIRPLGEVFERCQYEVDDLPSVDTPADLEKLLAGLKKTRGPETAVVIRSMGMVRWKFIVEAFNAAVAAKFEKIGFGSDDGGRRYPFIEGKEEK